jgi:hypothetical protein
MIIPDTHSENEKVSGLYFLVDELCPVCSNDESAGCLDCNMKGFVTKKVLVKDVFKSLLFGEEIIV